MVNDFMAITTSNYSKGFLNIYVKIFPIKVMSLHIKEFIPLYV